MAKSTRSAWIFLSLVSISARAQAGDIVRVPIVFHVAQRDGASVAPPSFLAEQLTAANQLYRPLGLELVAQRELALAARHAELVTRADRNALARYVERGAVHCFVVSRLMDVDEPSRERRGVHWHPRHTRGGSFVIISKISGPYVLAHELGHYFGNPQHSEILGNLMSYERTEAPPFLDSAQIARVRATLASLLNAGQIVPIRKRARGAR